ncbi:hypothetical protein DFH27DRAFT_553469 [Peziza echinospora]|nr:hypothetical protein DFH27DRAFT_553469 [Peziza echinospora]
MQDAVNSPTPTQNLRQAQSVYPRRAQIAYKSTLKMVYRDIDCLRSVSTALPLVRRNDPDTPTFHIMKLPAIQSQSVLTRVLVEWGVQGLGLAGQGMWWTSYVILAKRGTLNASTSVLPAWDEFGTFPFPNHGVAAMVAPRADGIWIADISRGASGTPEQRNIAVAIEADVSGAPAHLDVFACLVATGTRFGAYQVMGHARLEYTA